MQYALCMILFSILYMAGLAHSKIHFKLLLPPKGGAKQAKSLKRWHAKKHLSRIKTHYKHKPFRFSLRKENMMVKLYIRFYKVGKNGVTTWNCHPTEGSNRNFRNKRYQQLKAQAFHELFRSSEKWAPSFFLFKRWKIWLTNFHFFS
jgi:hypothetical protein